MEKNHLLLPISILAAGAMIGVGLFLGLRERQVVVAPAPTPAAVSEEARPEQPATPTVAPPEVKPPEAPAMSRSELHDKVQTQTLAALEKHRAKMVSECWQPSAKKDPSPSKATFAMRFLFDGKGGLVQSGVGDSPIESRKDVSQCLRDMKLPISVPAPGAEVGVQITFTLP